jgi:pyruvate/2-oxoglutarate dehydrogenase complex dihydrolipoamide dehydrogenase (E3) component
MARYDLVIVGGGTAGLVAAELAAALGARVALIERARTGGDCLWAGCVPSKSLLAAADLAHRMRSAGYVGLAPVEPEIDFGRVMAHVHGARRTIEPQDSPEALRRRGVEVLHGEARFTGPGRLAVGGHQLAYRSALIATGSRPVVPSVDGLDPALVLTNETVWDLQERPQRLAILGGGPIGCELGQAFRRLGSQVTIVQRAAVLLTREEPEASELVAARLTGEGVQVRLRARAVRAERVDGAHSLVVEHLGRQVAVPFDRLLAGAGRRPDTDGLGLDAVGVETDARGAIKVDDRLATTGDRIYAAGDAVGTLPFTHVAAYHARVVVGNALFRSRQAVSYGGVPWVTFTDPEVARVGLSEAQARERFGRRTVVHTHPYEKLDRAITAGRAYGFAKLVGGPHGRLVGATVAAPRGGEAIAEMAAWIAARRGIDACSRTVHAYPTFAEGPARAADDYVRARRLSPGVRRLTRPALAVLRRVDSPS